MRLNQTTIEALRPWFPSLALDNVKIVTNGPVCWYVRNVAKQGAMTISPFIFYGRDQLDPEQPSSMALLAHELKHVEQYRTMGHVAFLAKYLRDLAKNRFKYAHDLPLEAPAYALQHEVREALQGNKH